MGAFANIMGVRSVISGFSCGDFLKEGLPSAARLPEPIPKAPGSRMQPLLASVQQLSTFFHALRAGRINIFKRGTKTAAARVF